MTEKDYEQSVEDTLRIENGQLKAELDRVLTLNAQYDHANKTLATRVNVLEAKIHEQLNNEVTLRIARDNDLETLRAQARNEIDSVDSQHKIKYAALHQQFVETNKELDETRDTFGKVKHTQKQQQNEVAEREVALRWFLNLSSKFKGNIQQALGRQLTMEEIIGASKRYTPGPTIKPSDLKVIFTAE